MSRILATLSLIILINFPITIFASTENDSLKLANWQNKDPKFDKAWGISTERAYSEILKGKKSKTVIVAVIDNGVDVNHEDLKDNLWVNAKEIPGNGIDDDNNGYIDDIHGWNFLGNASGENINEATLEVTRLFRKYSAMYDNMSADSLKNIDFEKYQDYKKVRNTYLKELTEVEQEKAFFDGITAPYNYYDSVMIASLGKSNYTLEDLKKHKVVKNSVADTARRYLILLTSNDITKSAIKEADDYFNSRLNYHFNLDFNSREIIGDDVYTWNDETYGNNDVSGANPDHGTTVAGIIAANRNNNLGIKGIADNVKIMCIRAVPDGDEWDKDVANAIKYAIDNGADVINMSFGKSFSPQQKMVEDVLREAAQKDVLLVHAAGNDNENNDVEFNFPRKYSSDGELIIDNWISVGASTIKKSKKEFVAEFSNYGQTTVDIFAPGVSILSCTPGNGYDFADGTSFAAPMVAGAAALIKSYYPELTALEIKELIMEAGDTKNIKVVLPGTYGKEKKIVPFQSLSVSGGLLNVYKALELAGTK